MIYGEPLFCVRFLVFYIEPYILFSFFSSSQNPHNRKMMKALLSLHSVMMIVAGGSFAFFSVLFVVKYNISLKRKAITNDYIFWL